MNKTTSTKTTSTIVGLLMAALILLPSLPSVTADASSEIQRSLPDITTCGSEILVTLHLDWGLARGDAALFIEEGYPMGWTVTNRSHGGSLADAGTIKWFLTDPSISQVSYKLALPSGAAGTYTFSGAYRDDTMAPGDADATIGGPATLTVACPAADVHRTALPDMTCGGTFTVQIQIEWHETHKHALAIEERPPAGWVLSQPSNGGSLATPGAVKWFINESTTTQVTYRVTVPSNAAGSHLFTGSFRDDSMGVDAPSAATGGDDTADVTCGSGVSRSGLEPRSCGNAFTVLLALDWSGASSLFIEETYPSGWAVSEPSHGGSTSDAGTVKWFLSDPTVAAVSYRLTIPAQAAGTFTFAGAFRDDTMASDDPSKEVVGERTISVSCGGGGGGGGPGPASGAQAHRATPSVMHPQSFDDQSVLVTLHLTWNDATTLHIQEAIPTGVSVSAVSHGGSISGTKIQWTLNDPSVSALTYRLSVASSAALSVYGAKTFSGTLDDDVSDVKSLTGTSGIRVLHRYDSVPDCAFTDNDLFTAITDWKAGMATDNELLSGIDAWKLAPGSYCTT